MIEYISFHSSYKSEWDTVVNQADNGHFMFLRDYMEYHKDRFVDASYLVQKDNKVIATLSGTRHENLWNSHGGLTFGGLMLLPKYNRISIICEIYELFFQRLKQDGFTSALIKPVPWIYHESPCEGELYYLNRHGYENLYAELSTTIPLKSQNCIVSSLRKRMQKKAIKAGLMVQESSSYSAFWNILSSRLNDKYDRLPVHTCEEIELLAKSFPSNIRLFCVFDSEQECVGGSVIFVTNTAWHAQYISANSAGMDSGALDLLFLKLIDYASEAGKLYFDFGISTENNGEYLNKNLALFKESFGGRGVVNYKIQVRL